MTIVSSSTEIWRSTGTCEGECALSMKASGCRTKRLTCKYASASLFILLRYPKSERIETPNLHLHAYVFPHYFVLALAALRSPHYDKMVAVRRVAV